jgi:heme A synthase
MTAGKTSVIGRHRYLLLTASVLIVLLNIMGGVVCVTESGLGCPDWPGCYGRPTPPLRMDAIIEYSHRLLAALTSAFIVASAAMGWGKVRSIPWVHWPPVIAIPLLVAVSIFGALAVLRGLEPGLAALDLGSALTVQAMILAATVVAFYLHRHPTHPGRLLFQDSFAKLSLWTLLAVFVVLVSGVLVATDGTLEGCLGWPQGSDGMPPLSLSAWPQLARWLLALAASVLIAATVVQVWRTQRAHRTVVFTATVVGALWFAETVLGASLTIGGRCILSLVLHVAAAATLWAMLVVLVVLAGLNAATAAMKHQNRAPDRIIK